MNNQIRYSNKARLRIQQQEDDKSSRQCSRFMRRSWSSDDEPSSGPDMFIQILPAIVISSRLSYLKEHCQRIHPDCSLSSIRS